MQRGFGATMPKGTNDFLDLEDGDTATLLVTAEPIVLDIHGEFGETQIPCGTGSRNACPVCEDEDGAFTAAQRKISGKAFWPVYVTAIERADGKTEKVNRQMVHSGKTRLHEAYTACYKTLAKYDLDIFKAPLEVACTGAKTAVQFSVQRVPNPDFKITPTGEPVDVESIADKMIEKGWEAVSYVPGKAKKSGAKAKSATVTGTTDGEDPFDDKLMAGVS